MGQAPEQAEDRSELRIFLAEDGARYQLRVRPFPVSGDDDISTTPIAADVSMALSSLRQSIATSGSPNDHGTNKWRASVDEVVPWPPTYPHQQLATIGLTIIL